MTSLVPYYGSDSEEENEEESNTNTLQSKLPQIQQPKRIAQSEQSQKGGLKRIVVDFSRFGETLEENEEEEEEHLKKKLKLRENKSQLSTGLTTMLPPPKNSNPTSNLEKKKQELHKKEENQKNKQILGEGNGNEIVEKENEEEEEEDKQTQKSSGNPFFNFNFEKHRTQDFLEEAKIKPSEIKLQSKDLKGSYQSSHFEYNHQQQYYYNDQQSQQPQQPQQQGSDLLRNKEFQKILPKYGRDEKDLDIKEISSYDILQRKPGEHFNPHQKEGHFQSSFTKPLKSVGAQEKRKGHITYLASRAAEMERELAEKSSHSRMTKRQTQAKYGF